MTRKQIKVTFEPSGRTAYVLAGTYILEGTARAGLPIDTPCGGAGVCGKCRVQMKRGAPEPTAEDRGLFSAEQIEAGWRLACQTQLTEDAAVHLPQSSLFADQHQILTQAEELVGPVEPAVRKQYVELPEPTLADSGADLQRVQRSAGEVRCELPVLRALPRRLREANWKGTAVVGDGRLIDFEPGDTTGRVFGAAFDIGTTTLVGSLLDLSDGEELAVAATVNPQVRWGDDVLSRIEHCRQAGESPCELQQAVVEAINQLLERMCSEAGVEASEVYEAALAGNTTMEHLLVGLDVGQLGELPFVPVAGDGLTLPANALGICIHPQAASYLLPVIGGFVGGDVVAGLLATRLAQQEGPVLLVDIGTNGEIVLAQDGKLTAASTAAGPAFEGARIRCGMRAAPGAIEKAVINDDVDLSVIGGGKPAGLCGSALVDLAAELLRTGLLTPEGRLLSGDELPDGLPEAVRRRVRTDGNGQPELLLSAGEGGGNDVVLTQRDIRELQLASGAIRAGVTILLRHAGLTPADLRGLYVAGGFGSYIRKAHAQRIGLLPADIPPTRIHYVGNASLNGARWSLLSTAVRQRAEWLARHANHIELAQDLNFQMEFAEAMIFPTEA